MKETLDKYIERKYGKNFIYNVWSDLNNIPPSNISSSSHKSAYWKCENKIHNDFYRRIDNSKTYNYRCPICAKEKSITNAKNNKMNSLISLIGKRFGHLVVTGVDYKKTKESARGYLFCDCDCGDRNYSVEVFHLKNGSIQNCHKCHVKKLSGENNYNWKGGTNNPLTKLRGTFNYRIWKNNVLDRCNHTCQCCGDNNGSLDAHHILDFASYENERFNTLNGIALCKDCHSISRKGGLHNIYGSRNTTPEQLEEYINNKRNQLGILLPFSVEEYRNGVHILKPEKL